MTSVLSSCSEHTESGPLLVGVDAGGTTTRALITTSDGARLGQFRAGGANPNSHGPQKASAQLAAAVAGALDRAGPGSGTAVAACVVGLAGVSGLRDRNVRTLMHSALARAGVKVEAVFVGDDEVAFASGTPVPDGTVLIAGTGAIATRVEARARVRSADGMGWLLGDAGSAFWIGRRAAKEAVQQIARGGELGPLTRAVSHRVLPKGCSVEEGAHRPDECARALARELTAASPLTLAELAPLVGRAHEEGDPAAVAIVTTAAEHLACSVHKMREPEERSPVVLTGGVLSGSTPVREELVRRLSRGPAGTEVVSAGCTAGGAAWLAALGSGADENDRALHAAFTLTGPQNRHPSRDRAGLR